MALINADCKLCDVILNEPSIIPVINRFGIILGVGDKSIRTVCEEKNLDCEFFVTILNTFINEDYFPENRLKSFCATQIVDYLTQTNAYYQQFQIPNIERHFNSLISQSDSDNNNLELMKQFFEELKKELATLRGIMRHYVMQIDSLNVANKQLREENAQVTRRYREVSATADQLKQEREELTEKVTLASKLDAVGVVVTPIDSRGKVAKRIKKTDKIKISFSIAKNVTAEVGEKYIYARIVKPDGDVLVKDRADVFPFEDREINYSCRKLIEFTGDELNDVTMYWAVEEFLYPGEYRVDIFADNYKIGTRSFTLKE